MTFINCKEIAQKWKNAIKMEHKKAKLVVIQVGDNPASAAYINGKRKDCEEVGFDFTHIHITSGSESEVRQEIKSAIWRSKNSSSTDGLILQLPMPDGITLDFEPGEYIPPSLDVDGFNRRSMFKPCTPDAIMEMFKEIGVDVSGKHCVVAGRSDIVGKPMARLLTNANATVSLCHSKTSEDLLIGLISEADIFVSAVGKPGVFPVSMFKDGAIIVDVGISRTESGLRGDILIDDEEKNVMLTPVPGGVGLLTRAMLLRHVMQAHKNKYRSSGVQECM